MNFRVPLVAGNWKMNKNCSEAALAARQLADNVSDVTKHVEVFVAPAFTALSTVSNILSTSKVSVAAQDVFWKEEGPFTGEVSATMLKDTGCKYVIVGHSERRKIFHETNEIINKKTKATLSCGMSPVICFGETKSEREKGETISVISKQIITSLKDVPARYLHNIVLAYEPVWAIGSGNAASRNDVQEIHSSVRFLLKDLYPDGLFDQTRIIYGGSINLKNIEGFIDMPDIDGALIGGASLEIQTFSDLIQLVNKPKLGERKF